MKKRKLWVFLSPGTQVNTRYMNPTNSMSSEEHFCGEAAPIVEFTYLALTHMPADSCHRQFRPLLLFFFKFLIHVMSVSAINSYCLIVQKHSRSHSASGFSVCRQWLTATKCTVQPVTRTPASKANLRALAPLKEGRRDGWMFSIFPRHLDTNPPASQHKYTC